MIATNFIYNFGQAVLDSAKYKPNEEKQKKGLSTEEDNIIEEYEGECEKCQEEEPSKACPVCGA